MQWVFVLASLTQSSFPVNCQCSNFVSKGKSLSLRFFLLIIKDFIWRNTPRQEIGTGTDCFFKSIFNSTEKELTYLILSILSYGFSYYFTVGFSIRPQKLGWPYGHHNLAGVYPQGGGVRRGMAATNEATPSSFYPTLDTILSVCLFVFLWRL